MKFTDLPSVERLRASSDFDEKLVTIWSGLDATPGSVLFGTSIVLTGVPDGVSWSSTIFDVTPKLPSIVSLLKTWGYSPPSTAVPHGSSAFLAVLHPGGSSVEPATIFGSFW